MTRLASRGTLRIMATGSNINPKIDTCVQDLKSKIPAADYPALESRLQALINDPDTDDNDVITILREEFDPEHG